MRILQDFQYKLSLIQQINLYLVVVGLIMLFIKAGPLMKAECVRLNKEKGGCPTGSSSRGNYRR